MHVVSGCPKLAQEQYKTGCDNVDRRVHWEVCKKHELEISDRWYEHIPAVDEIELYLDLTVQADMTMAHNRSDIILVEKAIQQWTIIDTALPGYFNVVRTEDWKVEKYQDITFEVKRIHHVETDILPLRNSTKAIYQVYQSF